MGPEVEYFPNVSAICGTLQLNAIISVPGSECQLTGHDRATNSRLTGGATAPRPPGKSLWLGRELDRLWVQWAGTTGLCGDTQRASEGSCAFRVCLQVCVPAPTFLGQHTSSSSLCASVHMLRHPGRGFTERRLRSVCGCVYISFTSMCHHRSVCSHTSVGLLE